MGTTIVTHVDIWTIDLDAPGPVVLSDREIARAARFHDERDRAHWGAAHSALRRILGAYLGLAPEALEFVVGPHGKPALAAGYPEFNLSHSRGRAMVAVSPSVPVGVDIEGIRDNVDMAKLLTRAGESDLPPDREALFRRWTEREARTKAAGSPLLEKPPDSIIAVGLDAPPGFVASVALVGAVPRPSYRGSV